MGKCVDQVYFMEKWSRRQGLKVAISQKSSRGVWKDVTPPSTFQNRIRSMRNIVGKFSQIPFCRSIEIHPTNNCRQYYLKKMSLQCY